MCECFEAWNICGLCTSFWEERNLLKVYYKLFPRGLIYHHRCSIIFRKSIDMKVLCSQKYILMVWDRNFKNIEKRKRESFPRRLRRKRKELVCE